VSSAQVPVHVLRPREPGWEDWLGPARRDVYHTAGYHIHAGDSREGEPHLVVVGDRRRGFAWPYLLRSVAEVPGLEGSDATDVTSVYGYPGPLAWGVRPNDEFLGIAWREVVETWRQQHAVAAFTRFNPLLENVAFLNGIPAPHPEASGIGPIVQAAPTISIDCTLPAAEVVSGYARDLRTDINASRRAGLRTFHDESWEHLPEFTRLYNETMARSEASAHYFFDEDHFRRLRAALPGNIHLHVTHLDGEIAAAGVFTEFEGIVQSHLVGTNQAFLRARSPYKVLLADVHLWARARGNRVLHLGGGRGGQQDSLYWFKSRFSQRRHAFHVGRWVLDPGGYDELVESRRDALAPGHEPGESFFPAYRGPVRRRQVETAEASI
jgi:hypothetical protein